MKTNGLTLKARLERMEQRVTLLKQHKSREPDGICDSPYSKADPNFSRLTGRSSSPLLSDDFPDDKTQSKTTKSLSFCQASSELQHQPIKKRNLFNTPTNSDRSLKTHSLECSPSQSFALSPPHPSPLPPLGGVGGALRIDSSSNCSHQNHKKQIGILNSTADFKKAATTSELQQDEMSTEKLYYLCLTETCVLPDPQSVKKQSAIEVPCWRFHPVTSCYQLEGTENIDDDIFLKRHMKLEIDEKRRKRWDIQRIREQRHNEKLRRGRLGEKLGGKNSQDLNTITSFCPESKDVQFVEVSEQVPVTAFGCIIPNIKQSNFSLDWFAVNDCSKDFKTKKSKEPKNNSKRGT